MTRRFEPYGRRARYQPQRRSAVRQGFGMGLGCFLCGIFLFVLVALLAALA